MREKIDRIPLIAVMTCGLLFARPVLAEEVDTVLTEEVDTVLTDTANTIKKILVLIQMTDGGGGVPYEDLYLQARDDLFKVFDDSENRTGVSFGLGTNPSPTTDSTIEVMEYSKFNNILSYSTPRKVSYTRAKELMELLTEGGKDVDEVVIVCAHIPSYKPSALQAIFVGIPELTISNVKRMSVHWIMVDKESIDERIVKDEINFPGWDWRVVSPDMVGETIMLIRGSSQK